MDIYNGDVVSLVSSPAYDPNAFVHGVDRAYWNSLIKNDKKPLSNKAVSGLYPPGSTIKTLVALSALDGKMLNLYLPSNVLTDSLSIWKYYFWQKSRI